MKIYVASSWRNEFQPAVVAVLRSAGHEVYDFRNPPNGKGGFAWSDIDPDWQNWTTADYSAALIHPIAIEGFNSDFDGMKWADACVMVLPCGRSANTEAGWMAGQGKPVFVYSPTKQEPELMYKIYDGVFGELMDLQNAIGHFEPPAAEHAEWKISGKYADYIRSEMGTVVELLGPIAFKGLRKQDQDRIEQVNQIAEELLKEFSEVKPAADPSQEREGFIERVVQEIADGINSAHEIGEMIRKNIAWFPLGYSEDQIRRACQEHIRLNIMIEAVINTLKQQA